MGIPVEIMTAEEFATGVKLQKVTVKRFFAGDKHPLKVIHKKLRDLHAMSKGKLDDRHKLMYEINDLCLSYAGGKPQEKRKSPKIATVFRLGNQAANRALLERLRGIEIAEKATKGKGKALVGTLKFEALNVPGPNGIRGDELAKLAKEQFGVELTGDDGKDFYALKKIMKELKGKGDQFTEKFNLVYLDAEQRLKHLLVFTDAPDKGLALKNGEPYTSRTKGIVGKSGNVVAGTAYVAPDMYAVDPEDGSFFTCQASEYAKDDKIFHHSSFLAGRKSLCAGMIVVNEGRLIEISDESGHYKPQIENLLNACEIIVASGYDPSPDAYVVLHDWAATWQPKQVVKGDDGEDEEVPATFRVPFGDFLASGGNPDRMLDFLFVPVGFDPVYANPEAAKARGAVVAKL